ncbi:dihydrodipicolinate reductase [Mangrovimicrobium sediminis]|uniref:Dihydrodipicolinate reductase n=1 Tax=Mangrovimicrobium sediminis TaxID=2562682 RepID=A0A4Z0M1T2_9GAMM|nr:SRPBCC family protein [Haliea sp. SAOS-164]TGD73562.1 dihydrodipicolinate reductase [Haliea sp. SAOS-164]
MLEVIGSRHYAVDAQRAWETLSNWGDVRWIAVAVGVDLEQTDEGLCRRYHVIGTPPLDEILLLADAQHMSLRYRIPPVPVMPLEDFVGEIHVQETSKGGCRVDWRCSFNAGELSEEKALAKANGNLDYLLDCLGNHLEKLRVVQWASGNVGASSLRAVIDHPALQLVGLHAHSEAKEGCDAGVLCGMAPTGVLATRDLESVIALRPDCVLYMPEGYDADALCRMLEAGINVVTTRGEFFNPVRMNRELRERIEAACQSGGSSLYATGVSPGFITEALPLALATVARRLDCITIDEYAYIPESCSTQMILEVMGYGREPTAEFDPHLLAHMAQCFEQSLGTVSDALGIPIESVVASGETAVARKRTNLPQGGAIEPGTVAAQRITVAARLGNRDVLRFRANWYCSTEIDRDWALEKDGWRVLVEGDAPLDVRIGFPRSGQPIAEQMAGYTAHRAVNAVSAVCAAAPGICTILDLPRVAPRLG